MILIIIRKIYPAAEPDALVDIVLVGVVVSLDAVQNGGSADHQRHWEEDDHRSARKERTKRVVVPQRHSPKTWLPVFTRAGELVDGSVSEAYSSRPCTCKNRNGENSPTAESMELLCVSQEKEWQTDTFIMRMRKVKCRRCPLISALSSITRNSKDKEENSRNYSQKLPT